MLRWMMVLLWVVSLTGLTGVAAGQTVRLQGAGATFPNPMYQRWVTEYQRLHPNIKIDYQSQGSGAGIRAITERTVAFAGSDAPMTRRQREELARNGFEVLHIPTVAGAVVMAYNLPGVTGELRLSGEVIADIYMGRISNWSDRRIAELNPGLSLPSMNIVPAFRTDGSGTTFIFTSYLSTQSEEFRETIGNGTNVRWPTGQGGRGNEGVTQVVQSTPGAIGYVELIYAAANNIPHALLRNRAGKFVKASPETVANAGEGAAQEMRDDFLAVSLWNQPGDDVYPISGFTYILIFRDLGYLRNRTDAQALLNFLAWATSEGQAMAAEMGYAPLSPAVREKVQTLLGSLTFRGEPIRPE
ncbi:MAG: phosphate ABC transporter substrate-binding protein PstS [Tepidisphaerales bacterium]